MPNRDATSSDRWTEISTAELEENARRLGISEEVGGVPFRELKLEEVTQGLVDLKLRRLLDRIVHDDGSYEIDLRKLPVEIVPFRSRVYRRAKAKGLISHVYRARGKPLVRIHSHDIDSDECELCDLSAGGTA